MQLRKVSIPPRVYKYLEKLENNIADRIVEKLYYYASLPNPKDYAEAVVDFEYWSHRYRIGDYRVIVDFDDEGRMIIVGLIGNRRDVYK